MKGRELFIILMIVSISSFGQLYQKEKGYGGSVIYNLPIGEFGFGARMHYHYSDYFIISPQISFFPGFNQLQELNGGLNLMLNINPYNDLGFYLTGGAHLNWWMNYEDSPQPDAKAFNFNPDFGAGLMWNYNCIRPFAEYRVSAKYWESNVRLGIMWYPFSCGDGIICPAYYP